METTAPPTKETAETRYKRLAPERQRYLTRAHECAKLTIPSVVPSDVDQARKNEDHELDQPWQSVGSMGVNTLAAKMLLTILPPNSPFFMYSMGRKERAQLLGMDPQDADKLATQIEAGLRRMETEVVRDIEATPLRTALFGVLKHLLIAGNCLLFVDRKPKAFPLNRFVVERDASGSPTLIIVRELVARSTLPKGFVEKLPVKQGQHALAKPHEDLELYTIVERESENRWVSWQEAGGLMIPGTRGTFSNDALPWLPLRMIAVDGEDYGRSYVEELYGDLQSADSLSKSEVQGAMIAARLLWLNNPNGLTDTDDLVEAANGDVIDGRAEDVSALQANKFADFQVADAALQRVLARLERAFLMNSSVQRQGERVTAYEIAKLTQEIEDTLGGYYSILAQELQLPIVQRWTAMMQRSNKLPKLPKGSIEPMIVTGISALGRGQDLTRLRGFVADLEAVGKSLPGVAQRINEGELIDRLANGHGVDTTSLIKSDAEIQAEQAQAQQAAMLQEMVSKGTAPAIQATAKASSQGTQ